MSLLLENPEELCICETEENLKLILKNIEERHKVLSDLDQYFKFFKFLIKIKFQIFRWTCGRNEKLCVLWRRANLQMDLR